MGAYVSQELCKTHHDIAFNCTIASDQFIAGTTPKSFEGNPDIAGVGVLAAFFAISSIALLASIRYLYKQIIKGYFTGARGLMDHRPILNRPAKTITSFSIMENIILSCSDQQIFTSGAYAVTLRWAQCCRISAYHYNIVGNMMLMGCATHLLSMIVVSQYWKSRSVAIIRIFSVAFLYVLTGIILANQNTHTVVPWPSGVPNQNETSTTMILPAACFLSENLSFLHTLDSTFASEKSLQASVMNSTPGNHVVGWNLYILLLLFYIISFLADIIRAFCNRYRLEDKPYRYPRWFGPRACSFMCWIFWGYQVIGTFLCGAALINSFKYILRLRKWMDASGLIAPDIGGKNPENDPTTFGQMVPILMISMTLFTFIQDMGEKRAQDKKKKGHSGVNPQSFELLRPADPESQSLTPYSSQSAIPVGNKNGVVVGIISVPSTPVLGTNDEDNGQAVMSRASSAPLGGVSNSDGSIGTGSSTQDCRRQS